jgi:hypothetical protein
MALRLPMGNFTILFLSKYGGLSRFPLNRFGPVP